MNLIVDHARMYAIAKPYYPDLPSIQKTEFLAIPSGAMLHYYSDRERVIYITELCDNPILVPSHSDRQIHWCNTWELDLLNMIAETAVR